MKYLFKKYEFDSEATAKTRIAALENDEGVHRHSVKELGYLWTTEPTFDDEGNQLTEGVKADKYSVDMMWRYEDIVTYEEQTTGEITHLVATVSYPYGWSSKEIQYNDTWINNNGAHEFSGWQFYEG